MIKSQPRRFNGKLNEPAERAGPEKQRKMREKMEN